MSYSFMYILLMFVFLLSKQDYTAGTHVHKMKQVIFLINLYTLRFRDVRFEQFNDR